VRPGKFPPNVLPDEFDFFLDRFARQRVEQATDLARVATPHWTDNVAPDHTVASLLEPLGEGTLEFHRNQFALLPR
jgi:hypothetical protein